MKNYLYISRTKTEMLFGQLAAERREKISAEVGVSLGVFKAKIASELPPVESVVGRAQIVSEALRKDGVVGTLDSEAEWIEDSLSVKAVQLDENPNVFLLSGTTPGGPILLAGSAANVISGVPSEPVQLGYSYLAYLAKALQEALDRADSEDDETRKLRATVFGSERKLVDGIRDHELADIVDRLNQDSRSLTFRVGFLALKLFSGMSLYRRQSTILSPLYVYSS